MKSGVLGSTFQILSYLRPYRGQAVLLFIGMTIDVLFYTLFPYSFKLIIDEAIIPRNGKLLVVILGTLGAATCVVSVAAVARDFLYARLSTWLLNDLRLRTFNHLQQLSMAFYSRVGVGDLLARFTSDLSSVENAIVLTLPSGVMGIMSLLLSVALMFLLDWRMALLALIGLPLCLVGPQVLKKRTNEANLVLKQEQGKLSGFLQENLGAQSVVKAFGLQDSMAQKFKNQVLSYARVAVRSNFLSYMMERTPNIAILIFELMIIVAGSVLALLGQLSIGTLVTFHAISNMLSSSVYAITWAVPQMLQASAGLQRIDEVMSERPGVADRAGAVELAHPRQAIELRQVRFGYSPERLSLDGVSLAIPQGESVAIVGGSGSGKSTIISLIMRFYDPQQGSVSIDGIDLRDLSQDSLRRRIGLVLQENLLFNSTIGENIRIGKLDADRPRIEAAARAAGIHDFIMMLPQGYDTVTGERGGFLSGGQRQRVAIARALVRDPAILILDEATSALDAVSEAAVSRTLWDVSAGRTVIWVTHRLATVVAADRIFVLDQGRVAEQGRHSDLLKLNGMYQRLWEKQSGFSISGDGEHATVSAERLQRIKLFENLDPQFLLELAGQMVSEQVPGDNLVVEEGRRGSKFYIIVRGKLEVVKAAAEGGPTRLRVLDDGDYFGENALLWDIPRSATVRTLTPSLLLSLRREQFMDLLKKAPHIREILENRVASYPDFAAMVTSRSQVN